MDASGEECVLCYACNSLSPMVNRELRCPRCDSDFVEIIESDQGRNRPGDNSTSREPSSPPLPPFDSRPSQSPQPPNDPRHAIFNHRPWPGVEDDFYDDDNGPRRPMFSHHSYRSPDGRFTLTRTTFTGTAGGRGRSVGSPEPFGYPDPLMQTIGGFLQDIAGAYDTRGRGATFAPDQDDDWDAFASPPGQQNRGGLPGLFPRDTDGPRTAQVPLTGLVDLFNILRNEAVDEGRNRPNNGIHFMGTAGAAVHPLSLLANLLSGGRFGGDAVYSQEELDHVISQLIDQNTNQGPPPASESAIQSLPKKKISQEMLGPEGRAECSICMDPVELGKEVTELPCKHWFHGECIEVWLKQHNTCPHCRRAINEGDGAPGTRDNPVVVSSSPPQSPQRQSANDNSGSSLHGGRSQSFGSLSPFSGNHDLGTRQSHSAPPESEQSHSHQNESQSPSGGITGWLRSRFGSG